MKKLKKSELQAKAHVAKSRVKEFSEVQDPKDKSIIKDYYDTDSISKANERLMLDLIIESATDLNNPLDNKHRPNVIKKFVKLTQVSKKATYDIYNRVQPDIIRQIDCGAVVAHSLALGVKNANDIHSDLNYFNNEIEQLKSQLENLSPNIDDFKIRQIKKQIRQYILDKSKIHEHLISYSKLNSDFILKTENNKLVSERNQIIKDQQQIHSPIEAGLDLSDANDEIDTTVNSLADLITDTPHFKKNIKPVLEADFKQIKLEGQLNEEGRT